MEELIRQFDAARQDVKAAFMVFMSDRTRANMDAYNAAKSRRNEIQCMIMNYKSN